MATASTGEPSSPRAIVERYKIQDRGRSRGVTVPATADFQKGDLAWVWSETDSEGQVKFLSITKQPPKASSGNQQGEICEHYTIQRHGGRKLVTIPNECGEEFADETPVVLIADEPAHLRIIPQQVCVQTLTRHIIG
jgi:hypothetical protein